MSEVILLGPFVISDRHGVVNLLLLGSQGESRSGMHAGVGPTWPVSVVIADDDDDDGTPSQTKPDFKSMPSTDKSKRC
jgi:hypothetical protein